MNADCYYRTTPVTMKNSIRTADDEEPDGDFRSPRLPHMRYTSPFREKKTDSTGAEGVQRFTSFGRPWIQYELTATNPRATPETPRHSSVSIRSGNTDDSAFQRIATPADFDRVGGHGRTGDVKHANNGNDRERGQFAQNPDAFDSRASNCLEFLPPPPEFADHPPWATTPRSPSRMFLESKRISSQPPIDSTAVGKIKANANLATRKMTDEKRNGSDAGDDNDDCNDDDDDDDDEDDDDEIPPPLPTSSPPKIPFSFLHTELDKVISNGTEEKSKVDLTLYSQSLFGAESDSSESRDDDDDDDDDDDYTRNELFSPNDEFGKYMYSNISVPYWSAERLDSEKTKIEPVNEDHRVGKNDSNEALNGTKWSTRTEREPTSDHLLGSASSEDLSPASVGETNADPQTNLHNWKTGKISTLKTTKSIYLKDTYDKTKEILGRNELSVGNAQNYFSTKAEVSGSRPLTPTTSPFTRPDLGLKLNSSDKNRAVDKRRLIDDTRGNSLEVKDLTRAAEVVDSVSSWSNEETVNSERSSTSEETERIGTTNPVNRNVKTKADTEAVKREFVDRKADKFNGHSSRDGTHFENPTERKYDFDNSDKNSSFLLPLNRKLEADDAFRNTSVRSSFEDRQSPAPTDDGRPLKVKDFGSTWSIGQLENEENGARNALKKQSSFEHLETKLRDDARERLQKLKSPSDGSKLWSSTSVSCLPVIANSTSARGTLLPRDNNRRAANYETVVYPGRFGFQSTSSITGSLLRSKHLSTEDLKDWGTRSRSLPRNMECIGKWSITTFDEPIDRGKGKDKGKMEEEATGKRTSEKSNYDGHIGKNLTTDRLKCGADGGYHRLSFSLPRPAKNAEKQLQLQTLEVENPDSRNGMESETHSDRKKNTVGLPSTNYSQLKSSEIPFASASNIQPNSNYIRSNRASSVFTTLVLSIPTSSPDPTLTPIQSHSARLNSAEKFPPIVATTTAPTFTASREIPPRLSLNSRISAEEPRLPSANQNLSPSPASVDSHSPVSSSRNHSTHSSFFSVPAISSKDSSQPNPTDSVSTSPSDQTSTASVSALIDLPDDVTLPCAPVDPLNEPKEDADESELDASFTYFRISHKSENENEAGNRRNYSSNLSISLSSANRTDFSDSKLASAPTNQRLDQLVDTKVTNVSSIADGQKFPESNSNHSSVANYSAPRMPSNVKQIQISDASWQSKQFVTKDACSDFRKVGESEGIHSQKLQGDERLDEEKPKKFLGNWNSIDSSSKLTESVTKTVRTNAKKSNQESDNARNSVTVTQSAGHNSRDQQTTPKIDLKAENFRIEVTHPAARIARSKAFVTEKPASDQLLSSTAENFRRNGSKNDSWSGNDHDYGHESKNPGHESKNRNHLVKEETSQNWQTSSLGASHWNKNRSKEEISPSAGQMRDGKKGTIGIPSSTGHKKKPDEGDDGPRDVQRTNKIRGFSRTSSPSAVGSRSDFSSRGKNLIEIDIIKGSLGICFCLEGGKDSPHGDGPIRIKRIFHGAPDFSAGREKLRVGDELISVNGQDFSSATHYDAWKHLRTLPEGLIKLLVRRT